uniref:Odorant binding protein 12a n=1 Tax=Dendroctonus adjunctus TaxID=77157 RepID=A0A7U3RLR2_9CUCU|nr:Odorant binding protein 12a [Dendroctonus adjunctus]
MFGFRKNVLVLVLVVFESLALQKNNKCDIPLSAPKRIEEVINTCQDEIKIAILSEALEAFKVNEHQVVSRAKRSAFNEDEKKIAGCLLQCVYRKLNAVNEFGFPTVEGLVSLYTEGVTQKEYIAATRQAVTKCLDNAQNAHEIGAKPVEASKSCEVAYEVFDCVSLEVAKYCGQTP